MAPSAQNGANSADGDARADGFVTVREAPGSGLVRTHVVALDLVVVGPDDEDGETVVAAYDVSRGGGGAPDNVLRTTGLRPARVDPEPWLAL
jgi:hypothetical protein